MGPGSLHGEIGKRGNVKSGFHDALQFIRYARQRLRLWLARGGTRCGDARLASWLHVRILFELPPVSRKKMVRHSHGESPAGWARGHHAESRAMSQPAEPHLERRFGLLQATALNITDMIGIGPFITIPTMMATINGGGPQCLLGWIASLLIVLPDGLIWAELGAAMPAAGGSYSWLREGFGRETWGRLMAFLFIWQFIISAPMEIGTGFIGVKQYLGFLFGDIKPWEMNTFNVGLTLLLFFLLYRRIDSVGKITVWLWVGTMITVLAVIFSGVARFDPKIAFAFPDKAFNFSLGFLSGLGAATRLGIYDYLGYYDVCFIGGEVRHPGKVIPRSILLSLA